MASDVIKRFSALTAALLLSLALAACTGFANTVSDNWPTWAGGMPKDVPPRPGTPGYEEFIAHQQSRAVTPTPSAEAAQATPGSAAAPPPTGSAPPPAAAAPPAAANAYAPAPPTGYGRPDDRAVAQGGLY
ncbi:MAG TPA: hypothetical protein VMB84_16840 [Stellaceae bacterium]|nr:hypothetical protein [Stellaceae bacterium]